MNATPATRKKVNKSAGAEFDFVRCFGNVDVPVPAGLRRVADAAYRPGVAEVLFTIPTPGDGDKRLVWDRYNLAEVADARQMFYDLVAQGMTPHLVGTNGRPVAEVLSDFDPLVEEVSFLDDAEERQKFPGSRLARRVVGGAGGGGEVVFLPMRQFVGG